VQCAPVRGCRIGTTTAPRHSGRSAAVRGGRPRGVLRRSSPRPSATPASPAPRARTCRPSAARPFHTQIHRGVAGFHRVTSTNPHRRGVGATRVRGRQDDHSYVDLHGAHASSHGGSGRYDARAGRAGAAGEVKIMSVVCPRAPRGMTGHDGHRVTRESTKPSDYGNVTLGGTREHEI
jgi:hypothetical protein